MGWISDRIRVRAGGPTGLEIDPHSEPTPLDGVDVLFCDLDGVVYAGANAIPGAVEAINAATAQGVHVGYLTNNASRTDAVVAEQLRAFGLDVAPSDIVTSPQAAVELLRGLVPDGSTVLVVGGDGLTTELESAGFRVTRSAEDSPAAVVQGFHPSVGWLDLAEASYALRGGGIPWIATNQDWTIPQTRGIAPGNGTLVSAVHIATGLLPIVAGKPERAIFDTAVARFGAKAPLMVGDRLDTDILGANRAGIASATVLTGIDGPKQLLAAREEERPSFILADLGELHLPYPAVERAEGEWRVGRSIVRLDGRRVLIAEEGDDRIDLLRAACALIWESGTPIYALEVAASLYE